MKPFSQACENNKRSILEVIQPVFESASKVLEVGSGTGQHALYFAQEMPHLIWQTSDRAENHKGIDSWIKGIENILPPIELDVLDYDWNLTGIDAVFSANTVHIMGWIAVKALFEGVGSVLSSGGYYCLYGPFLHNNEYSSESNREFDQWLKQRDAQSGIRDFDALNQLAHNFNMQFISRHYLPANNEVIVWQKP